MAERVPAQPGDGVLEALIELARSAARNQTAASERRAKITVVDGRSKRGGRAA